MRNDSRPMNMMLACASSDDSLTMFSSPTATVRRGWSTPCISSAELSKILRVFLCFPESPDRFLTHRGLPAAPEKNWRRRGRRSTIVGPVSIPTPPPPVKSKRALLWTSTTYFGEGLPWSFLHQMATEFLTQLGVSKSQIASTSGFHLAVTFKFLWSPLVDLFGRKRTWLWVMQVLLGLGMLVVAFVAPRGNLTVFWSVMAGVAIMHAVHDIACDGFYLQALDKKQQALY